MEDNKIDDGSLAFLGIKMEGGMKYFDCPETKQQDLINLSFWIVDYLDDVKTKFGENRFILKIKMDKNDPESLAKKFFTNSQPIKFVVGKIAEMNAFPRRVTMKKRGNTYYFE